MKKQNLLNINKFNFRKNLSDNFKRSKNYLKTTKKYILFSSLLFLISIFIGYLFPVFFKEQVLKLIEEIVKETEGLGLFRLIIYIMLNNIQSAFSGIIFGLFFGIVPVTIAVVNGYILGFVANKTINSDGIFILWKLFPHGIFELPAILISIGLGLKLGIFIFISKSKNKKKEFLDLLLDSLRVFVFILIPLLILAAIIEGTLIFLLN